MVSCDTINGPLAATRSRLQSSHSTVVGFKLRGHFKFFFIIMSDLDRFLTIRWQLYRLVIKLEGF